VTTTHQIPARVAAVRSLLAAIVLVLAALTASSAAAATSTIVADPSGSPTASVASVPAPETTTAGPSGASPAQAGQSPILYSAAPSQPGPSAVAGEVRAQPAVIAPGSSNAPLGHPTRSAGASTGSRPSPDQSIVSTTHHASPDFRPAVAQLSSGGPLVEASGSAAAAARVVAPAPRLAAPYRSVAAPAITVRRSVALPDPVLAVSVPLVGVYISSATSARHPGQKPSAAPADPVGIPAATVTPFGAGPLPQPGGMTALYGNVPFSSSAGTMAPLIQLSALLAAMTLLAGISWRRRSWDLPVLAGDSALLASALDRPG
jgi:hypothetical protein